MEDTGFFCYHELYMARTKPTKGKELSKESKEARAQKMSDETRQGIWALVLFIATVLLILSAFSLAGIVGQVTYEYGLTLLGNAFYALPAVTLLMAISFMKILRPRPELMNGLSGFVVLVAVASLLQIGFAENMGGIVGYWAAYPLVKLFDIYISSLILVAISLGSLLVLFDAPLSLTYFREKLAWITWSDRNAEDEETEDDESEDDEETAPIKKPVLATEKGGVTPTPLPPKKEKELIINEPKNEDYIIPPRKSNSTYTPPSLSLLEGDRGKPGVGDIKANANIIKRTLANFGIEVEMDEISIGPSITRYALKPAEGVKLTRILGLQNDLSLALAAHPLRIEAPIPGKSLVGIEIPNTTKAVVGLGSLLGAKDFQESANPLMFALGRGTSGMSHFANLAKSPHLLIAGTTGSGKSVGIHTIITSLLYRNSPEDLRFIMVDPKRVELTLYNKIPHLLTPVITDPKKAILALKWATKEMDRRYNILEGQSVRDIQSYHKNNKGGEPMPYIVVIIDELADLMTQFPREIEALIVRLAQMSRAVGIHLILSTQRPSVEVITGLIKANVPSRIAFQVPSLIDSRTIIDTPGAEKLLGSGDMLYLGGEMSKPQRIQSAYISENEVKKVVDYLIENYEEIQTDAIVTQRPDVPETALFSANFNDPSLEENDDDELYEQAREIVMQAGKASTSYLQRRLKVGYARAARLIDLLEERGVVGPGEGAKPREVLQSMDGGGSEESNQEALNNL